MTHAFSVTELENQRRKIGVPGVGVSIVRPESIEVLTSGYRKQGSNVKIQNPDKFHLGSNTKAMTATLVAKIIETRQLSWNTTLREIFPELPLRAEFLNVTVEMLAAHRSGITGDMMAIDHGDLWSWMWHNNFEQHISQRYEISRRVLSFLPEHTPGTKYLYSNWNYILLGAILEKLTQQTWEELMWQKLFQPLGMLSCGFGNSVDTLSGAPNQPWPHVFKKGAYEAVSSTQSMDNPVNFGPAGTVHCSLEDWSKFLQIHLDGFRHKEVSFLSETSFSKLHTPYPGQDYTPGGWLTFIYKNHRVLQHAGSNTMNFANVWLFPNENIGVAVAVNAADTNNSTFRFTDSLIGSLLGELGLATD